MTLLDDSEDAAGTGEAWGVFGPGRTLKRRGAKTDARLALLAELWPSMTPTNDVLAALNALPGLPVFYHQAVNWACDIGVQRPREASNEQIRETVRARRVLTEPPPATAELNEALRRIAAGNWTFEKLSQLCSAWVAGHSTAEIGRHLGVTKNAVVGKAHRLIAAGLLSSRESPIKYNSEPRAPRPRAVNKPAPKQTLPSLRSAEPIVVPKALPLPSAGYGPMRYDFRSPRAFVPAPVVRLIEPRTPFVADDGSSPTGPSLRPCQYVVRDGSTSNPLGWVMCGMGTTSLGSAWCRNCRSKVYVRAVRRVAA